MPSRAPCSTGASYSYTSFGKHGIVNTQSILNHNNKSDFNIDTSPFSKSDLKRQSLNTYSPFSKSDSKRRSLKAVRFAEPNKDTSPVIINDENLVNERLEMSAADVMAVEALYATVRKRHSPVKERLHNKNGFLIFCSLIFVLDTFWTKISLNCYSGTAGYTASVHATEPLALFALQCKILRKAHCGQDLHNLVTLLLVLFDYLLI